MLYSPAWISPCLVARVLAVFLQVFFLACLHTSFQFPWQNLSFLIVFSFFPASLVDSWHACFVAFRLLAFLLHYFHLLLQYACMHCWFVTFIPSVNFLFRSSLNVPLISPSICLFSLLLAILQFAQCLSAFLVGYVITVSLVTSCILVTCIPSICLLGLLLSQLAHIMELASLLSLLEVISLILACFLYRICLKFLQYAHLLSCLLSYRQS